MNTESFKGKPCPYKPITCQEGYCQDCQIYLDFRGHERTMGRVVSLTPDWLIEYEKEQIDKLATLRAQIQAKRREAFAESIYESRTHSFQLQAMVNAYDVVLELIDKGEK